MSDPRDLVRMVRARLARDRHLSASEKVLKAVRFAAGLASARLFLAACSRVGRRARTIGRPIIDNRGRIDIGDDFTITSTFNPSQLATGNAGLLSIGDRVFVNFGCAVVAHQEVKIGNRVHVGPYSIIADTETADALEIQGPAAPISIGDDVWLAGRVTVRPGAVIGHGAVIGAGSVVSGEIPPGVIAAGNPARVLRRVEDAE